MYKLCVFGDTTEGRELVEYLNTQPCRVTACVATEYGQTLLPEGENLTVSARPLPVGEIGALLQAERFDLVIDATHPYAASITRSIAAACEAAGVEHWRLLRGASEAPEDAVFAENTDEAVRFLSGTEGNILLTTGSKELSKFAALPDFAARCWARVLPLPASLEACGAAGLSPSHIFALQGPFSREMDEAMLHRTGARWLVTKDGGAAGGFQEKAAAARHAGARLLVIGRPAQETGSSLPETIGALCASFGFSCRPRVTIVGIGPGSEAAQTGEVRAAIRAADGLIGARRMLEAVARPGQLALDAIAPEAIADRIREHPQCRRFTVVMSGDTGFFSGTKKLLPLLQDCETTVLPGLSSLSYLCARLGVSYESVVPVSLHGRVHDIVPDVRRNKTVFVLVGGEGGMALAEEVVRLCETPSQLTYAYPLEETLENKIRLIAQRVYGAKDVAFAAGVKTQLRKLDALGPLPVCMAKTQYSLSDNPKLVGRPEGFTVTVRQVRLSAGAGFVVAFTGEIFAMPGLPKVPAAEAIDVNEAGEIEGLF